MDRLTEDWSAAELGYANRGKESNVLSTFAITQPKRWQVDSLDPIQRTELAGIN